MFEVADEYLDVWKGESKGKVLVITNLFGEIKNISIEECFEHWFPSSTNKARDAMPRPEEDMAYRLSLLPCVREVLTKLPYEPVKNDKGNWEVEAIVPKGVHSNRIEVIRVVIAYDDRRGWYLKTYYPYWDTTAKKKQRSVGF